MRGAQAPGAAPSAGQADAGVVPGVFTVVFPDPGLAVAWAAALRRIAPLLNWPPELLTQEPCEEVRRSPAGCTRVEREGQACACAGVWVQRLGPLHMHGRRLGGGCGRPALSWCGVVTRRGGQGTMQALGKWGMMAGKDVGK
jgi:hypothetical protein